MATLLIVAGSDAARGEITELLSPKSPWKLLEAADADRALSHLDDCGVDLLLLEIGAHQSDEDLVPQVRERFPRLPILIIAPDEDRSALVKALMLGAASYVPRGQLARELKGTIERLLALAGREHRRRLADCLQSDQCRIVMRNEREMIPVIVGYLQDCAEDFGLCQQQDLFRLAVALEEALTNSLIHGNLEVGSELRGGDEPAYASLIERRLKEEPYCRRTVSVVSVFEESAYRLVITDEGPGFDPSSVPDPTDPANLEKPHGRGLMLMNAFMDEVHYNEKGNQVTLIKRRPEISQTE